MGELDVREREIERELRSGRAGKCDLMRSATCDICTAFHLRRETFSPAKRFINGGGTKKEEGGLSPKKRRVDGSSPEMEHLPERERGREKERERERKRKTSPHNTPCRQTCIRVQVRRV